MLVLGRREMEERTVSVRSRAQGNEGGMPLAGFVEKVIAEVQARR
jgi:threonyl-tRNA synthetase